MTAPEPEYEYAIEWVSGGGRHYVGAPFFNLAAAERHIAERKGDGLYPQPVRVMRRPVAEWLPAPTEETQR